MTSLHRQCIHSMEATATEVHSGALYLPIAPLLPASMGTRSIPTSSLGLYNLMGVWIQSCSALLRHASHCSVTKRLLVSWRESHLSVPLAHWLLWCEGRSFGSGYGDALSPGCRHILLGRLHLWGLWCLAWHIETTQ